MWSFPLIPYTLIDVDIWKQRQLVNWDPMKSKIIIRSTVDVFPLLCCVICMDWCVCLCLAMLSLHASFPGKMRKCLLAEWFPLFWKFLFFSPNMDSSYFTHAHKEKQEETWRFLTSWPSDMIESVLVPSQTKGSWKQRVSTWFGLHVAMDRGRREGSKQSCHAQHLFIQTVHLLVWNEQA